MSWLWSSRFCLRSQTGSNGVRVQHRVRGEPKSLAEALDKRLDAAKWVNAALTEIGAHLRNGTWELVRFPPSIGRRWVCKVKRTLEGAVNKYKGQSVARSSSQLPGIYYGEIFVSADRLPQYGP